MISIAFGQGRLYFCSYLRLPLYVDFEHFAILLFAFLLDVVFKFLVPVTLCLSERSVNERGVRRACKVYERNWGLTPQD